MTYGQVDPAEALRMYERLTKGSWWSPRVGSNRVRIMPPWLPEFKRWWFEWTLHWNISEKKAVIPCLKLHGVGEKRCAICEEIERLKVAGDPRVDPKTDHNILPSWSSQISLIDLSTSDVGVQTYGAGITVMRGLLKWENNPDYGDITNPEKGYDITIDKFEKTPWYDTMPARNATPLRDMSVLDDLPDLSEVYTIWTYSEQIQWLRGEIPKRGEGRTNKRLAAPASTITSTVSTGGVSQQAVPQTVPQPLPATQPAPTQTVTQPLPTVADVPVTIKKPPRCFGTLKEGDPICEHCKAWVVECRKLTKTKELAATSTETPTVAPRPRCFGKEFSKNSPECQECGVKLDCVVACSGLMQ